MDAGRPRRDRVVRALAASVSLLMGCGGGDGGTGPAVGALAIQTVTTGQSLDPDGYTVDIPGHDPVRVPANGVTWVSALPPRALDLVLGGIAQRCSASGGATRQQTIVRGDTVTVRFDVACEASGTLRVHVRTIGDDQDADGYHLLRDVAAVGDVGRNGELVLDRVAPGTPLLWLDGVAPNCEVWDAPDRRTSIVADDTTDVQYDVSCLPTSVPANTILLRVRTFGDLVTPDGYQLWLDGIPLARAGANATMPLTGLSAGEHELFVGNGPLACARSVGYRRTVSDAIGAALEVRFFCHAARPDCTPDALRVIVSSGVAPTLQFSERCHFDELKVADASSAVDFWSVGGSDFRPSTLVYGRPPVDATRASAALPLVVGHEYMLYGRLWTSTGLRNFTTRFTAH